MSEVRKFSDVRNGGRLGSRFEPETQFWAENLNLEDQIEGGKEKLGLRNANGGRSTSIASDPWIKTNKTTQNPTREQILGMAIFCGDFRIGEEQSKKRLESRGEDTPNRGNRALDTN